MSHEAHPGIRLGQAAKSGPYVLAAQVGSKSPEVQGTTTRANVWKGPAGMRNQRLTCLISAACGWGLAYALAVEDVTAFINSVGMELVYIEPGWRCRSFISATYPSSISFQGASVVVWITPAKRASWGRGRRRRVHFAPFGILCGAH